ncbi:MAG TPA: 50S ribosomal protein L11 methyltransferase [Gemmatimonadaceae bacterium]|nr:50S ribosomal protein L11 methyltransferase [Gemmatimonadaceae bacterium]
MTARWLAIRIHPGRNREAVLAALFAAGAAAVEELGDELVTQLADRGQTDGLAVALRAAAGEARFTISSVEPTDWSVRWRESIRRHELGALTITPPWLADGADPRRTVVIQPGMAFGTGEHATTRGLARLLQHAVRVGDRAADLGTGSAVLAIAAAKLGAARVAAIELDHDAIANAEENVERNGVADRVTVIEGDAALLLPLVAPVRVITANILSSVLVELLPTMRDALGPDGVALLGGIMERERTEMLAALEVRHWRVLADDVEDGWWGCLVSPA